MFLSSFEKQLVALRRFVVPTTPTQVISADSPLTIFLADGFHFRERDGRVLLLWPDTPTSDAADTRVPAEWLARVQAMTDERVHGEVYTKCRPTGT